MSTDIIIAPSPALSAPRLFTPTAKTAKRVLEFFTAHLNNDHTRKAYLNATRRFAAWCEAHGLHDLAAVQPVHVAAFIRELQGRFTLPTVKQHPAALRMLFDWLGSKNGYCRGSTKSFRRWTSKPRLISGAGRAAREGPSKCHPPGCLRSRRRRPCRPRSIHRVG
jgi:hypothetical protein